MVNMKNQFLESEGRGLIQYIYIYMYKSMYFCDMVSLTSQLKQLETAMPGELVLN